MALNVKEDLQQFREEWRKELSKSSSSFASAPAESESQNHVENRSRSFDLQNTQSSVPVGSSSNFISNADEDSQGPSDLLGINYNADGSHGTPQNQTAGVGDEYYPFKIVTQFLNEAPRKVKQRKKRGNIEQPPEMTYAKKKYFNNALQEKKKANYKDLKKEESTVQDNERMLDLFIADLDEINEIPFFDSTLPREVAFKIFEFLDMATLCICSLISRSWKSLADDDMLWCRICHNLGFDTSSKVFEGHCWKERVQQHMRQKKILEANWKARVGKPYQLNFARGRVLCNVATHESTIVAGYTNCQVKSWNTISGDTCTFNASNTALVIDENAEDLGCIRNEIRHLSTTANVTAASFKHGFVDIWRNDHDLDPVHTMVFSNPDMSSLCAHDDSKCCSLVAASQNTRIQVARIDDVMATRLVDIDMKSPVYKMVWMDGAKGKPRLVVSCSSSVWLKDFDVNSPMCEGVVSQDDLSMVELHNLIYAPITCLGARQIQQEIGVGFNMYTGSSSQVKLNIYDLNVRQPKATFTGHTWIISCMDLPSGIPHELVTGSGDRKVRLFDVRGGAMPTMTLMGHSAKVTSVQMDKFKVVSGDEAGFLWVWDVRTGRKLWDIHNRHPVQFCHFDGRLLIIGNIPYNKFPESERDEFESVSSLRYRGTVQFYDFLADQQTQGVPEICLSSYSEPEASDYNLNLAVPYDSL